MVDSAMYSGYPHICLERGRNKAYRVHTVWVQHNVFHIAVVVSISIFHPQVK
jgi:hypothetical protein